MRLIMLCIIDRIDLTKIVPSSDLLENQYANYDGVMNCYQDNFPEFGL